MGDQESPNEYYSRAYLSVMKMREMGIPKTDIETNRHILRCLSSKYELRILRCLVLFFFSSSCFMRASIKARFCFKAEELASTPAAVSSSCASCSFFHIFLLQSHIDSLTVPTERPPLLPREYAP